MNAVVLTVKASYVASTKYRKLETKVLMLLLHQPMAIGIAAIIYSHLTLLPLYITTLLRLTTSTENWRIRSFICYCMNNNLFAFLA